MLTYNCKLIGGNIPEGDFIIVQVQALNAGAALPIAINGYLGSIVKELELIE